MNSDAGKKSKDFVQSVDRGLSIIKVFNEKNPELTLSEVAELTGFTRATARRFLLTLEELNYVGSTGRHFYLKPRVLELGYAYLSSFNLVSIAQTHLEELTNKLHESCSVSVLQGHNVIYICRAASKRIMTINLGVGAQLPAYATSMGRVLLASLSVFEIEDYFKTVKLEKLTPKTITDEKLLRAALVEIKKNGFAITIEELEYGVQSVSIPIHGKNGLVIAAANVSAHAGRTSKADLVFKFLPLLREHVKEIELILQLQK